MAPLFALMLAVSLPVTNPASGAPPAPDTHCHRYAKACGICFTLPRAWRVKVLTRDRGVETCYLSVVHPLGEYGFSIRVDRRPFETVAADLNLVEGSATPLTGQGWSGLQGEYWGSFDTGNGTFHEYSFIAVVHGTAGASVVIDTEGPWDHPALELFLRTLRLSTDQPCGCVK